MRAVARQIGSIVRGFNPPGTWDGVQPLFRALSRYAETIDPWANAVARSMLADVSRRNARTWRQNANSISKGLRQQLENAPLGGVFRRLLDEQVGLIKSLPLEAAQRVHHVVEQGLVKGTRASEIAKHIIATGHVTESRATLIAQTEVSRAAAALTQARAQAIGSEGYIWRTLGDGDVRPTHKALNGRFVRWDDPPKTDASLAPYHAGCGPRCRCFPEPVLPDY